ncbi:MAG: nuclear transport factor 2 family protein [Novosphingobium sp.]|nr:nuclear transport factor 2 family protein [Novosphingobium sp.]
MIDDETELRQLLEKQRIWECLLRYTRGMDRLDRELTLSAYHDGAMEDHGAVIAPYDQFVDRVLEVHRRDDVATQHYMTNFWCEVDGDAAHAETYMFCYMVKPVAPDICAFGRTVDRLEKRDGRWGIVDRVSIKEGITHFEQVEAGGFFAMKPQSLAQAARDRSDASYRRPVIVARD